MAHRRKSPAPYQTTRIVEGLEANIRSFEQLEGSIKDLDKALRRGLVRKKWEAQFDLLKSLEDFRITLEWVALASK
jgi:hypothetical protein